MLLLLPLIALTVLHSTQICKPHTVPLKYSEKGLALKHEFLNLFMVANLPYQLKWLCSIAKPLMW